MMPKGSATTKGPLIWDDIYIYIYVYIYIHMGTYDAIAGRMPGPGSCTVV